MFKFKKSHNPGQCEYIQRGYRYRLYPNRGQQAALAVQFGHCRWVYNWGLRTRRDYYREHHTSLGFFALKKMLPALKKQPDTEWLCDADSQSMQAKLEDLDRGYTNFFEGRAEYPHPKTRKDEQSIRYPQRFRLDQSTGRIYLPKVGLVKCVYHRAWEGTPKSVTVSKTKSGEFYVSILCAVERITISTSTNTSTCKPSAGVDLGLKHFVVLHTGIDAEVGAEAEGQVEKVEHPSYLRKAEKRLKRLHRALSRKGKGSNNRERARIRLARGYEHVARQREDFLHKLSTRLVREHSLLRLETLSVCGMVRNHSLAKSISDSGWGMFGRMCEYKGSWYGCTVERVDRFYPSSKMCSRCGYINDDLRLQHRFWVCPGCGAEHDRDANAALNLLQAPPERVGPRRKGMRTHKGEPKTRTNNCTVGATETDARRDRVRREGYQAQRSGRRSEKPNYFRVG